VTVLGLRSVFAYQAPEGSGQEELQYIITHVVNTVY